MRIYSPKLKLLKMYYRNAKLIKNFQYNLTEILRPIAIKSFINIIIYNLDNFNIDNIYTSLINNRDCARFFIKLAKIMRKNLPEPGTPYGLLFASKLSKRLVQSNLDYKNVTANFNDDVKLSSNIKIKLCQSHMSCLQHVIDIKDLKFYQITCSIKNQIVDKFKQLIFSNATRSNCIHYEHIRTDQTGIVILRIICDNMASYKFVINQLFCFSDKYHCTIFFGSSKCKTIHDKLGPVMYFITQLNYIFAQQFNKIPRIRFLTKQEYEIFFILIYQISGNGKLIALNRAGIKINDNNSGLEKICFEAAKQNLYNEALNNKTYEMSDSQSKLFFGQNIIEGTGYKFDFIFNLSNNNTK